MKIKWKCSSPLTMPKNNCPAKNPACPPPSRCGDTTHMPTMRICAPPSAGGARDSGARLRERASDSSATFGRILIAHDGVKIVGARGENCHVKRRAARKINSRLSRGKQANGGQRRGGSRLRHCVASFHVPTFLNVSFRDGGVL